MAHQLRVVPRSRLSSLADELGHVREQIRLLRAQEDVLRQSLLALPGDERVTGRVYQAQIKTRVARRLIRSELPQSVLDDPRLWREVTTRTVRTVDTPQSQRTSAEAQPTLFPVEDTDFDVIEPF